MSALTLSVLHVSQPTIDGVAVCVANLAAAQSERGWQVRVACPTDGPLAADARAAGAEHVPWEARGSPGPALPAEIRRLARTVDALTPDVVHLHSSKAGLAGRLAVRRHRPTIFQPHAWSFAATSGAMRAAATRWERFGARWTTVLVCCSQAELDEGLAAGVRGQAEVVPNAVDTDAFAAAGEDDRRAARERLGLDHAPLAVCIGRLSPQKGQDVLAAAWPAVRARLPAATAVLVGDGPLGTELTGRLPEGMALAGRRSDVGDWLAAADVVVAPSRYEGLSLPLLEAMATARSVVAADVAGMAEAIGRAGDDVAGAIVPVGDGPALAGAVAARLADPALAAREGRNGRARVLAHHRLAAWADRLCDLTTALA